MACKAAPEWLPVDSGPSRRLPSLEGKRAAGKFCRQDARRPLSAHADPVRHKRPFKVTTDFRHTLPEASDRLALRGGVPDLFDSNDPFRDRSRRRSTPTSEEPASVCAAWLAHRGRKLAAKRHAAGVRRTEGSFIHGHVDADLPVLPDHALLRSGTRGWESPLHLKRAATFSIALLISSQAFSAPSFISSQAFSPRLPISTSIWCAVFRLLLRLSRSFS